MMAEKSRSYAVALTAWLLVFCFVTFSPAVSYAADIRFGGIVPGIGIVHKKVVSQRESRYIDMVQQQTDFSCGAAALATILNFAYDYEKSEAEIIKGMLLNADPQIVRQKGFSLLDIKHYVQGLGMRGHGYQISEQVLEEIKIPVIALLDIKGYKHFVVLKKTTGDKVYIADPALGNTIMDRDDFRVAWNNIVFAVIGQGFKHDSMLLRPKQPLTVKRLLNVFAPVPPVPNAELLDFGFTHAELF